MKKADSTQPLSAMHYAVITVAGLIVAAGFTLFYIYQVPKLVANGAQGQIFYLLLIPWALSCAAFLFGAMKSYARFTYKHLGSFLELGGPVVLFCLVLVGGFKLVPPAPETFDLTVRAHSADQHDPIITAGKITLDLDNNRRTSPLGPNGEADFKGIPAKFEGATLRVLPQVEGFSEQWQEQQLKGDVLDLALVRAAPAVTLLIGTIVPPPAAGKTVKIVVEGQKGEASPDELGRFELSVNGKAGDRIRLRVYVDNTPVYDDYQVLPGPVTLSLHKPDTARREAPHGSSSATPLQSPITQGPGSALSINQRGGITAGTVNIDTHPHLVMTDTQRGAVRDAMTPFAGKRAFILINGATKEQVEFGTKLNAALVASGVNSEVSSGIALPVGVGPQLPLFVGFKGSTAEMARALIRAVIENHVLPGSEVGYHQYGEESQDQLQIIVSPLN